MEKLADNPDMRSFLGTRSQGLAWRLLLILGGVSRGMGAEPAAADHLFAGVSSIAQLRLEAARAERGSWPLQLDAVVCWSDPARGSIALQDDSGAALFDVDLGKPTIQLGDRIRFQSVCSEEGSRFSLGRAKLIDNNGLHDLRERSGAFFLTAGMHPIQVRWFDKDGAYGLEVSYQGPGLERQRIPDAALFHRVTDPDGGTSRWEPGLVYRSYEGTWDSLPEFSRLQPTSQGRAANFDLGLKTRTNDVGMEFMGGVEVPRDGLYTFFISSDDGSQLSLDGNTFGCQVISANSLPKPRPIVLGQNLAPQECGWSEVEGKVTLAGRTPHGIWLEISSGSGHITAELPDVPEICPLLLLRSQVRALGFCQSIYTPEGRRVPGRLLVPGLEQLRVLTVAPELWITYPVSSIATVSSGGGRLGGAVIQLRGKASTLKAHRQLRLQDATGEMAIQLANPMEELPDGDLDVLGQLQPSGANLSLAGALVRKVDKPVNGSSRVFPLLETVEQVHRLNREQAEARPPLRIRGIVTYVESEWSGLIQDSTRGVYATNLTLGGGSRLETGDYLEVDGVAGPGAFAPVVECEHVSRLGRGILPDPVYPTWDQLVNGSMDCQYVEIEGVVAAVQDKSLILLLREGRLHVDLFDFSPAQLGMYVDAHVRIRGGMFAIYDFQTHQVKSGLIRVNAPIITLDESASADPFEAPAKELGELGQFDARAGALHRVKVRGQVLHTRPRVHFLTDGTNGLRFLTRDEAKLDAGDLVEVVGFPQLGGLSPLLREALVRKTGNAPLPSVRPLLPSAWLNGSNDAARVEVEARLDGLRTNQTDQLLDLQSGPRSFAARLPADAQGLNSLPIGSRLRLAGVYAGRGGNRATGEEVESFDLLLNSPADIKILERPSWWTVGHTLAVIGGLVGVLLLAVAWISALRRQVGQRTRQLKDEIESHKAAEVRLAEEINERERLGKEKDRIHRELLATSRQAGMAEIATGVLHNVGNVLNSVNITATLVADTVRRSKAASLIKVSALLQEHEADLGTFIVADEKGKKIPGYLNLLAQELSREQQEVQGELASLKTNVNHIKEIVAMQQSYARIAGVTETVALADLVEDGIRMHSGAYTRHGVRLAKEYDKVPPVALDKHKALQIIVNLLQNAKYACDESDRADKQVTVRVQPDGHEKVKVVVEDNGMGISKENLTRIFAHGFTTRKGGHGFGLHSGALAAKEMGGALRAFSDGPGRGATFVLELPMEPPAAS